jgi:hypothetical protein
MSIQAPALTGQHSQIDVLLGSLLFRGSSHLYGDALLFLASSVLLDRGSSQRRRRLCQRRRWLCQRRGVRACGRRWRRVRMICACAARRRGGGSARTTSPHHSLSARSSGRPTRREKARSARRPRPNLGRPSIAARACHNPYRTDHKPHHGVVRWNARWVSGHISTRLEGRGAEEQRSRGAEEQRGREEQRGADEQTSSNS